jgi:hypothetical protein
MEDEEEDLDMAAAMGFSSFGAKKRKYDQTNSPKPKADASGANTAPLGMRAKKVTTNDESGSGGNADEMLNTTHPAPASKPASKPPPSEGLAAFLARAQVISDHKPQTQEADASSRQFEPSPAEMISFGGPSISKVELNALRFGVRNEHGDTAYFLPNFVQDPWENMKSGR